MECHRREITPDRIGGTEIEGVSLIEVIFYDTLVGIVRVLFNIVFVNSTGGCREYKKNGGRGLKRYLRPWM